MAMSNRTATDVAELESDNYLLRETVARLTSEIDLARGELADLRARLADAEASARAELVRATQMETILQQTSMGLVAGLQKMQLQKHNQRELRRAAQERALGVGDGDAGIASDQFHPREDTPARQAPEGYDANVDYGTEGWPRRSQPGSLRDEAIPKRALPPRDPVAAVRKAAEDVKPPLPAHLLRARPGEVRADITDHHLLPRADYPEPRDLDEERGTLRSMADRAVRSGEPRGER